MSDEKEEPTVEIKNDMDERFRKRDEAVGFFRDTVEKWEADPTSASKFDAAKVARAKELHEELKISDPTYEKKGAADDHLDAGSEVANPVKQP